MRQITVMVNNVEGYARGILRGVMPFAFSRGWECRVSGVGLPGQSDNIAAVNGVIVQAGVGTDISRLLGAGIPAVNVSSSLQAGQLPSVVCDDIAVGRIGAEHFHRLGFSHYLFYAPLDRHFAKLRQSGFTAALAESNLRCSIAQDGAQLQYELAAMPKPLAVMCCNDTSALEALQHCRKAGLQIPDQVAVLGVDNDDLMQTLAFPPLSSISTATERIGFQAAVLLEELMDQQGRGETAIAPLIKIPPVGIISRRSTDLTAVNDPEVGLALRFIRQHAAGPLDVADILRNVTVSRRQLERRFRLSLGRSLLDEIRRCRLERARQLLRETDLTIPQIATASGFSSASYMTVVFAKLARQTPGAFRQNARGLGKEKR